MIVWINGAFGSGKTTLSNLLVERMDNAILFDPELVGSVIHQCVPDTSDKDFQDFPMWRRLVAGFISEISEQFNRPIVVPMTLVNLDYLQEIFGRLRENGQVISHYFLTLDRKILEERIRAQTIDPDPKRDQEIREWRLDQVARCLVAESKMPKGTVFLSSEFLSSERLATEVLKHIFQKKSI